jgi:aminobenzoyl-glutamate transport protein
VPPTGGTGHTASPNGYHRPGKQREIVMTHSVQRGWLATIERLGNRLPHPTMLFVWLCVLLPLLSWLLATLEVSAAHPGNGDSVAVRSLLAADGLRYILTSLVDNFTGFAPLGVVLVAMLGIGIAERSGLIADALAGLVRASPDMLLVGVVALAGVLSSLTLDAGYVVLVPLAGLLFSLSGRSPLLGIAVAFASVSGGFSANLLLGPVDALLAGISTEAARLVEDGARVGAAGNYWFIIASTVLVVVVVTLVAARLQHRMPTAPHTAGDDQPSHSSSPRALRRAGVSLLAFLALVGWATLPDDAVLRHPQTGGLLQSPFMDGIVVLVSMGAALAGVVYGYAAGTFRNSGDVIEAMETTMAAMAGYLVLMFFAAQFVAWFGWTNMGLVLAVHGAEWLGGLALPEAVLLVVFVVMTAGINLLIGSASAKWSVLAPVFVPMLMVLGISPEATQAAYRVGDSSTNIITPLMPYFALVLGFARRYDSQAGVGTLIALMLPFSLSLLAAWSVLLGVWIGFGWPFGP